MTWTGWLTTADARGEAYWPTCDLDNDGLHALLTSAEVQCTAYAPDVAHAASVTGAQILDTDADDVPTEALVPETWRKAQAFQARALHRSTLAGNGDTIGGDGLTVTVFPLDWTVKALLRPARKPVVR